MSELPHFNYNELYNHVVKGCAGKVPDTLLKQEEIGIAIIHLLQAKAYRVAYGDNPPPIEVGPGAFSPSAYIMLPGEAAQHLEESLRESLSNPRIIMGVHEFRGAMPVVQAAEYTQAITGFINQNLSQLFGNSDTPSNTVSSPQKQTKGRNGNARG